MPNSKMPDLGWDIAKAQLQKDSKPEEIQELTENNIPQTTAPLKKMIAIAILIITILEHFRSYIQKIQKIARNMTQASHGNQAETMPPHIHKKETDQDKSIILF